MTAAQQLTPNEIKARAISRDFRTDTITMPTDEMIEMFRNATRGDSVYGEDQDTEDLQNHIAKLAGKEAGLFCVSGTMTNQLAIRTHLTQPPHSVLLDARAHVHLYEAGGVAFHSQANSLAISPSNGHHLTLEDVEANLVRGDDIHSAPTRIVALENTLSGTVFPQDEIVRISDAMRAEGVIMHCDGARMWEVVAKTGLSLEELCRPFDSVSLCMSKGLGAPIGSVLVGTRALINKAKWFRKLFGGGIRQSGTLAIGARYALDHNLPLLPATHALAASLASSLFNLGARLVVPTETHMCWIDPTPLGFPLTELIARAKARGITLGGSRIIVHIQITQEAVDDLVALVAEMKEEFKEHAVPLNPAEKAQTEAFSVGKWEGMGVGGKTLRMGVSYGAK
ncbi:threonine aldolase, partial [Phenoliferia sp. Uapishka_3]